MPRAASLAVLIALAGPSVAAASEDRYGPPHHQDSAVNDQGAAAPASGWLGWSRKSAPPGPEASAPRAPDHAFAALPTSHYSAYPDKRAEPAAPAILPQARWSPAGRMAAPPQPVASASTSQPPRRYSVAREFGLTPDPIPLPQQFFAEGSPDLAAPPPPLPPKPVPGTQAATSGANTASNRARQVALETADSAN